MVPTGVFIGGANGCGCGSQVSASSQSIPDSEDPTAQIIPDPRASWEIGVMPGAHTNILQRSKYK